MSLMNENPFFIHDASQRCTASFSDTTGIFPDSSDFAFFASVWNFRGYFLQASVADFIAFIVSVIFVYRNSSIYK